MIDLIVVLAWLLGWFAIARWSFRSGYLIGGAIALFVLSLLPTFYGRAVTPEEWHDYPLMMLYYLPTMLGICGSLIVLAIGLFRLASRFRLARNTKSR